MRLQVVTCNNSYKNSKYNGSYHEIHEIDNLRNTNHCIATIKSIVANHLLFIPKEDKLQSVIFTGDKPVILDEITKYFKENPLGVDILETETASMISGI